MRALRICIAYRPKLYREIIQQLFMGIDSVELVKETALVDAGTPKEDKDNNHGVDVIILPMEQEGPPKLNYPPEPVKHAKLIAFAPSGDYGMRLLPGEENWEVIRPFCLKHLLQEALGNQQVAEFQLQDSYWVE